MDAQQVLEYLTNFQGNAKPEDFNRIFGKLGGHLWDKYRNVYDYNIIRFYASLDYRNRAIFARALEGGEL